MLNRENIGLLIELPDNAGIGAVVDCTKQGKNLYKATVICKNEDICVLQFRSESLKFGEIIKPVDWSFFDTKKLKKALTQLT